MSLFLFKLKKINKNIISLLFLEKYVILIIEKIYFDNKSLYNTKSIRKNRNFW